MIYRHRFEIICLSLGTLVVGFQVWALIAWDLAPGLQ